MSSFEVYYDGGAKKMRPINNFKEYAAIRNSAKNRRNTKLAREGDQDAKKHMAQFCYSCLPNDDGTLKGTTRVSNSVGMDIDFAKDMPKEELEEALKLMVKRVLQMKDELRLLMLERSATKGLHIVFERHSELTQEENLEWAQKMLGVEFDKGAKDITRVFFTPTADPKDLFFCKDELFVNEAADSASGHTPSPLRGTPPILGGEQDSSCVGSASENPGSGVRLYNGLPYSAIIEEFLRQFNNGQTPVEGNRNMMTFELAKSLRSICGYSLDMLKEIIPRYDNFPEEEYIETLQNALNEPKKGINYKLQKVLSALYARHKITTEKVDFNSDLYEAPQMPVKLPYPLDILSSKVPEMYRPAVCESVFPPLATHVHGAQFRYWDGVLHELTLMSVLSAPMSIGKGCIRKPISIILGEIVKKDEANRERESQWKQKNPASKQKRDPRPTDICVQVLIDNLTDAVFNQRVYDAHKNGQRYLYTCVDELDTLKKITSRGSASEVSVIIRKAFDNSLHGQERVGADSVTGIAPLRFNFNASTTNRNCQNFFAREMTTGTITRLSMATIIKPSDAKRPVFKEYDEAYIEEVRKLTQKLSMLSGEISCPKCNKFAEQLCDENEKLASLYGSEPYLVLSYRATVIAWLKGMMLYVMNDCKWTKQIQDYMEWSLRYDLWVKMRIFGDMLDAAFNDEEKSTRRGPMNMLTMLKDEFTMEDLILVRRQLGKSVDTTSVKNQLSTWRKRKLVDFDSFDTVIRKKK